MSFENDLTRWFGRSFIQADDVAALKRMVNDYHTTMDSVTEAAQSVSYVLNGIGRQLNGLGFSGPLVDIGSPLSENPANNIIGTPSAVTPAQSAANTMITLGEDVPNFLVSNDPTDPYTVTPDYVQQTTQVTDAAKALPGEALTYASDTISKYFHYALIAGIVVGVVVFLPEIKAVTRVLRSATK